MSDRVVEYGLRSLAYFVSTNFSGFVGSYIISPDFDYDKKPSPSNPGNNKVARSLPFIGIELVADSTPPFTIGNILYEQQIEVSLGVFAQNNTELINLTSDCKQALKLATNPNTSSVGIPLYNYALASGSYYAIAGTLQIEIRDSNYFGPSDKSEEENRRNRSYTLLGLSLFKDSLATLAENQGRVDLTDS